MTLAEQFTAALTAQGERIVESRSRKYITMTRQGGGFWFIGRSGALRRGATVTGSFACSDAYKAHLIKLAALLPRAHD